MFAKIYSCGITGLDSYTVHIEVDVSNGLPGTILVGLPDNAVRESKERVRSAIKNSGFEYPLQRITVNLSPGDIKKEGPSFDLPIALGILAATGQLPADPLKEFAIIGELSLDGRVRPVTGALPIALGLKTKPYQGIVLPEKNALHAAIARTVPVYPVRTLSEVVHFLTRAPRPGPFTIEGEELLLRPPAYPFDFSDVKGQSAVKRGLEIAAAGGHNVLLLGPPGSGKTMLAKRLPTILPDMTWEESLAVTNIHSVTGLLPPDQAFLNARPFRSPHHTTSDAALVGGGSIPKPGEVSLAHHGVLFLDELPEFNRNVLETLRQPLEDHYVTISRAAKTVRFPAQFMFIASMNPCPCGYYTDPRKECHCNPLQIQRYLSKISGPLMDRIDIHLEVPAVKTQELISMPQADSSAAIKQRTCHARKIQEGRLGGQGLFANAHMNHKHIKTFCPLCGEGKRLLEQAIDELGLSARAHDKILRVARTIADMESTANIQPSHLAEAIQYRCLDRR